MNITSLIRRGERKLSELQRNNEDNLERIAYLIQKNSIENKKQNEEKKEKKDENNFILQYSPRTEYCTKLEEEEEMYNDLKNNFDPISIKIIKKHFKERLGSLNKEEMIAILKNHLLGFLSNHPQR